MVFKPIAFSIPSTTELKLTFSGDVSGEITKDNFFIESLSGNSNDLEITSVEIDEKTVLIKTRPQISGNYYIIKLLDVDGTEFKSNRGVALLNSDSSRELFFVGIDSVNPIRDRIYSLVPKIFDLEKNSVVKTILSSHAKEIYKSQTSIGEVLNNNYISVPINDERRVRTSAAKDRMSNENAYSIDRVSKNPSGAIPKKDTIYFSSDNILKRVPQHPVSLRQVIVEDEEISQFSSDNGFRGFLISFKNKNILKLLSLKIIRSGDKEDCDGNIGTSYNINVSKYAIKDNKYDPPSSYSYSELESNQILLSEFGSINRPMVGDKIIASYIYKDYGRHVVDGTIDVYRIEKILSESTPSNSSSFFLDNAPIVDENNAVCEKGGVVFAINENDVDIPKEFSSELKFNLSKLPSEPGEYSINYETGEVFLVGSDDNKTGTGSNNYVASYLYRHSFEKDLDFSIDGNDFVANNERYLASSSANIEFKYDKVYAEGVDYTVSSHVETINEPVENNIVTSFSIKTKNTPITNVFRIFNQTTGEVYSPLYHTDSEVYFSGRRSPEVISVYSENSNFRRVLNEDVHVINEFIAPAFSAKIISNSSNNSIIIEPGIPSEFINKNSENYYIRVISSSQTPVGVEDIHIKFFGDEDAGGKIDSLGINSAYTPPSVGTEIVIGPRCFSASLDQVGILNKDLDGVGSCVNSSISFETEDIFVNEKFFRSSSSTLGMSATDQGGIISAVLSSQNENLYSNLSLLRKTGDYCLDYKNGVIYVAVKNNSSTNLGSISYNYNSHNPAGKNIIGSGSIFKKLSMADSSEYATRSYEEINFGVDEISITELEDSTTLFENKSEFYDLDGILRQSCEVLQDYTVVVPTVVTSVRSVNKIDDIFGKEIDSEIKEFRIAESNSEELVKEYSDGGKNIYSQTKNSFTSNVIDLKTSQKRIVKRRKDKLVVELKDSHIDSFFSLYYTDSGEKLFDEKLNLIKYNDVPIIQTSVISESITLLYLHSDFPINKIVKNNDFILDDLSRRFSIIETDLNNHTITIRTPAENNSEESSVSLTDEDSVKIIVKPSITISESGMKIEMDMIPSIAVGSFVDVKYLRDSVPSIGTALAVDYRSGKIYLDYNYIKDEIFISYEYGNNSLDWSIGSAIDEGEEYFVTYKYGALRDALRVNFGALTKIPFFETFPLTVDRELYRSALEGTLQAFAKGPTIPAFEKLVSSFTSIDPEITEMIFGNWILGRDHLYPGSVSYSGDLSFHDGKFEDGLFISDENIVSIPRNSNISLQEGTVDGWFRPNWAGIDNDATLNFNINDFGYKIYQFKGGENPFDFKNDFDIIASFDISGSTDYTGNSLIINNYKSAIFKGEDKIISNNFILYRKEETLNVTNSKLDFNARVKINLCAKNWSHLDNITNDSRALPEYGRKHIYGRFLESGSDLVYGLDRDYSESDYINDLSPSFILIDDCNKSIFIPFYYSTLINYQNGDAIQYNISEDSISYDDFENFQKPHHTRMCNCRITDDISLYEDFNEMIIEIDFSEPIIFTKFLKYNNIVSDTPGVFGVIDANENIFEVVGFKTSTGIVRKSIPDVATGVHVKRKVDSVSYTYNKQRNTKYVSSILEEELPKDAITFLYKNIEIVTNPKDTSSLIRFGAKKKNVINWSEYIDIAIQKNIKQNLVKITLNGQKQALYYSSLIDSEKALGDIDIKNSTDMANSIAIGSIERGGVSSFEIRDLGYTLYSRYGEKDIYIGSEAFNPNTSGSASGSVSFSLNRSEYPNSPVGVPYNFDSMKGIFIGYDDLCESPFSSDDVGPGQWFLRTNVDEMVDIPKKVSAFPKKLKKTEVGKRIDDDLYYTYIETFGGISSIPDSLREFKVSGLSSYLNVFGIHIFSTLEVSGALPLKKRISSVSKESFDHIVSILSMYLDNNLDGTPDNMKVLEKMISSNSFMIIVNNKNDFKKLNRDLWIDAGYKSGTIIFADDISKDYFKSYKKDGIIVNKGEKFDSAIEDIFKFIAREGYSKAYPSVFGFQNSKISKLLNNAKTGSDGATDPWYRPIDGISGNKKNEIIDYLYWSITSILGAQESRCDKISGEVAVVTGTSSREIIVSPEETIVETVERVEESDRPAKLFGTYGWHFFDGTQDAMRYQEDVDRIIEAIKETGSNVYAHGCQGGVSDALDGLTGEYYGGQTLSLSDSSSEYFDGIDIIPEYSSPYKSWETFIELLTKTKGSGIKIYAVVSEKHHLSKAKRNVDADGLETGTATIYPNRWGIHRNSSPSKSVMGWSIMMRDLATLTLPEEDGGMGFDHLAGVIIDDMSGWMGIGLNSLGEDEFGYDPVHMLEITNAARDLNSDFKLIPTMYYSSFGRVIAKDGVELGCKSSSSLRPGGGSDPYGEGTGAEGASVFYSFEVSEEDIDSVYLSFSYNDIFSPEVYKDYHFFDEFVDKAKLVYKECFINDISIFSENFSSDDLISFFNSDDLKDLIIAGTNKIEIRVWAPGEDPVASIPKTAYFWDISLKINSVEKKDELSREFFVHDKGLDAPMPGGKIISRSNDVKNILGSIDSALFVYPKDDSFEPKDHGREHHMRVIKMTRDAFSGKEYIASERGSAFDSIIDLDIFKYKIDNASRHADGVIIYNPPIEILNEELQVGNFAEPPSDRGNYPKLAYTSLAHSPLNGFYKEWTTKSQLSGLVSFEIFFPQVYTTDGEPTGNYNLEIYNEAGALLWSGTDGPENKIYVSGGYINKQGTGSSPTPLVLNIATPTTLRLLWKITKSYGAQYHRAYFRVIPGEISVDSLHSSEILSIDGAVLSSLEGDEFTYKSGISQSDKDIFKYKKIMDSITDLYVNKLKDKVVTEEVVTIIDAVTKVVEGVIVDTVPTGTWNLCTKKDVKERDPDILKIVSNKRFALPRRLPSGRYKAPKKVIRAEVEDISSLFKIKFVSIKNDLGENFDAIYVHPKSGVKVPAVLYCHGEMINNVGYKKAKLRGYDLDSFAKSIIDSGYAVLIPIIPKKYNKKKARKWAALDGLIKNSFKFLSKKIDINEEKISLIGFSDGAVLAAYAASKWLKKDLSSLVLISPTFGGEKEWSKTNDLKKYFKSLDIDLEYLSKPSSPRLPVMLLSSLFDYDYVINNSIGIFATYFRDRLLGNLIVSDYYNGEHDMFMSASSEYISDIISFITEEFMMVRQEDVLSLYDFKTKYESMFVTYKVSGDIDTDGEFSSVVRSAKTKSSQDCSSGEICSYKFRYNGNSPLERAGWNSIQDSQSDIANVLGVGAEAWTHPWKKVGLFATNASGGIYRMNGNKKIEPKEPLRRTYDDSLGMFVLTDNPCLGGNSDLSISLRVAKISDGILFGSSGVFSGAVSGNMTGIAPVYFNNGTLSIKLSLSISSSGENVVLIIDAESNDILDIVSYSWNDSKFHEYKVVLDKDLEMLTVSVDKNILSRILYSEFKTPKFNEKVFSKPFISVQLFDGSLVDYSVFHSENDASIIDIDHILFTSESFDDRKVDAPNDIVISDDHKVEFSFGNNLSCKFDEMISVDGYGDGYGDGYASELSTITAGRTTRRLIKVKDRYIDDIKRVIKAPIDGYYDGYSESFIIEDVVNELIMSSDRLRYFIDMGDSNSNNRFSIFKDGKGFLNFRVFDNSLSNNGASEVYNIATNIKSFKAGELHHIAASWRLNSLDEKDSMHLFIDGLEVPNIFKFGGSAPVMVNNRFSDISREVLHNFIINKIRFYKEFSDGTVAANSSLFYSSDANINDDMLGRSIIIKSAEIATDMVGKAYIIGSIHNNAVSLLDQKSLDVITFNASDSNISFCFAPSSGDMGGVSTDIKNSKFVIYKKGPDGKLEEFGGISYSTKGGRVRVVRGNNVISPKYRANIDTGLIEFVGINKKTCLYHETASYSDIEIYIETFGLSSRRCNKIINVSSTSLEKNIDYDVPSKNISILKTREAEPSDISSVSIKKILMKRTAIINGTNAKYILKKKNKASEFKVRLDGSMYRGGRPKMLKDPRFFLTSQSMDAEKENLGRKISIVFESENIDYSDENNTIKIHGSTVLGLETETVRVTGNNTFALKKYFTEIHGIEGFLSVVDLNYDELCVLSIEETDDIFTSNNKGDFAEIYKYVNGNFILTVSGKSGTKPFVLNPGPYRIDYVARMMIKIPMSGEKLYIGCDIEQNNQLNGVVDELRVISEKSRDTRPTELVTSGTRSITRDYIRTSPYCLTEQTFALMHFDNPIEKQSRVLRQREFLNQDTNNKYRLDSNTREVLIQYINNSEKFISKMINMGYSQEEATRTFYEAHLASGGPIVNYADFYSKFNELIYSSNSVNSRFASSGRFIEGNGLLYNNSSGMFRKKEGTIEFWVSPMLDFDNDSEERKYVDIYSASRVRVRSDSPSIISLPVAAKSIVEVRLLEKTEEFSEYYTEGEVNEILFDEIYRSEITGRLDGGTGVSKDFAIGHKLSADGKTLFLEEALPGMNTDVIVTFIPIGFAGDRVSVYKNKKGSICFMMRANGIDNIVTKEVNWKKNTWHRIMCTYRTNSNFDTIRLFVDGEEGGRIRYGRSIKYGSGILYGVVTNKDDEIRSVDYKIQLKDEFRLLSIGSSVFGDEASKSRMDNIRFSRIIRPTTRLSDGRDVDVNYSKNINTVNPVVSDDSTTFIMDFDYESVLNDKFATVIDPKNGIFNFDIDVIDNFNKVIGINDGEIEDVIVELVNRLKPAHSNALVKFTDKHC